MTEWPIVLDSKSSVVAISPWVQIPPSPLFRHLAKKQSSRAGEQWISRKAICSTAVYCSTDLLFFFVFHGWLSCFKSLQIYQKAVDFV